eukprot:TRINITY_DN91100_c0_g1_i1.p1 TRINITY_DN91100_c0_g1~~TRINITY_DN91100_c0_g1_i1.p1  ORF type:complete len:434 (-),score=75.28 TRINITY_DN91100_c0_g1_i1:33-1334(-)
MTSLLAGRYVFCAVLLLRAGLCQGHRLQPAADVWHDILLPDIHLSHAHDHRFNFEGRWEYQDSRYGKRWIADWPCTTVRFQVEAAAGGGKAELLWKGLRARVQVTVEKGGQVTSQEIFEGCGSVSLMPVIAGGCSEKPDAITLQFPSEGMYTVSMRKLTMAAPFSMGLGKAFLGTSTVAFHGLAKVDNALVTTSPVKRRHIEVIGASDTAGYCVDGGSNMSFLDRWKYDNCDAAYPGELGHRFGAELSVEALAGLGLYQNYDMRWCHVKVGCPTMPQYFLQTMQSNPSARWDFSKWSPELVIVSLGGNDFNHQEGRVPTDEVFQAAYADFLDTIFEKYSDPVVLGICGMGTPGEKLREVDNDRCRPCPHVELAVEAYQRRHSNRRVHYIFVPCDGTVATDDDMGCDNHKNRNGQAKIADFLEPQIRQLMSWSD